MILRRCRVIMLFATIWAATFLVASAQSQTELELDSFVNNTEVSNYTSTDNSTSKVEGNSTSQENIEEIVKSHRRAHRFDTAESSPWVRVYNSFPGSSTETFFNYETRGNTSTHTSVEAWDAKKSGVSNRFPVERRESKGKIQDFLRVKPKAKESVTTALPPKPKTQDRTATKTTAGTTAAPTKAPLQTTSLPAPPKNDTANKGYIIWSSNEGGIAGKWSLDDLKGDDKKSKILNDVLPKDGSHWKVIGDGGDDGWQVVDDKGEVEWKIEYDDGEWRVTSTGEIPADAEWIDPEYIWGSADGSLEDEEYNSWQVDDYAYNPWVDPVVYVRGVGNQTWPTEGDKSQDSTALKVAPTVDVKRTSQETKQPPVIKETKYQFGVRRKAPEKSPQERTDNPKPDTADDTSNKTSEIPQADQPTGKSWYPDGVVVEGGPNWVQGYGSKTWEVDNTGWNSGFGGGTWITANKDFPATQWVPKTSTGQIPEVPQSVDPDSAGPKTPLRAWGTGYGSKTWKGNEWDSNVVWKTGVDSVLPWVSPDNSSSWKFPDEPTNDQDDKKPIVWSQPLPPSDDSEPITLPPPSKGVVRIKWPTRTTLRPSPKTPPSRRTEDESWEDDSSEGGVVWKGQEVGDPSADVSIGSVPVKSNSSSNEKWQIGNWKINSQEDARLLVPWKIKSPPKSSNLLSVTWKSDEILGENPPPVWNPNPWPGADPGYPAWLFGGCKMTVKCGSTESDTNDDSSSQSTPPDTTEETTPTESPKTTIPKGWPKPAYGKSWKPPTKSWKPPTKSWKPPTKSWRPPTFKPTAPPETPTPTEPTTIGWKNPPPSIKWPKPTPFSKNPPSEKSWSPPSTNMWTEPTPETPIMSRKPPMKWKKPGPRPTKSWKAPPIKSWKPPRTKSWKPPTPPSQTWKPSIATPVPDVWTTPDSKPDCKDTSGATKPTPEPTNDDEIGPPQLIIITKLPSKGAAPPSAEKPVITRGDMKRKIKGKSWVYPPKNGGSKTRKDKIPMPMNRWPMKPKKMSRPGSKGKGWPKGMLPPNFAWPANSMKRMTTRKPSSMASWKSPKYVKSKAWKQMFKKWMKGRMNM